MNLLSARRVKIYLLLVAMLNVFTLVALVATANGGVDRNGTLLGSDFISFWTAGTMLDQGADPYDAAAHRAAERAFIPSDDGYTAFFYPPSFLLLCKPLGSFDYFPALAAWVLATGAVYVTALRAWRREAGVELPLWLMVLAFPAIPIVVTHGQTAFLVAGLLGLGAWLVPARPVLAGILFGLATIKPQFGVLLPLTLLITREGKVIIAAAVTALLLAGLAALAFGVEAWPHWLAASGRAQVAMATGSIGYGKMVSPFAALKLLGASTTWAYGVQAAVSIGVAGLLAWVSWGRRWSLCLAALMLAAAPLVTPFVLDYDMVLLAFPLLWLVGQGLRNGFTDWEKLVIVLACAAPAFARVVAMHAGVPVMAPVMVALFALVRRRVRQQADR